MNNLLFQPQRNSIIPFLFVSMVLHLWLIWAVENMSRITDMIQDTEEERRSISVKLRKPPPPEPVDLVPENQPTLIEENPNANKEIVENAQILSTESSSAQEGGGEGKPGESPSDNAENIQPEFIPQGAQGFTSALLGENLAKGEEADKSIDSRIIEKLPPPSPKSGMGASFALSSYAWDWAPWVLDLRDKFGRTINPPPVYTHLGLVSGITRIKFVINRDGTLAAYSVLSHNGHEVLEKTTIEAVEAVFPFKPLPEDFPDPKLVIIGNFIYPDLRKLYGR